MRSLDSHQLYGDAMAGSMKEISIHNVCTLASAQAKMYALRGLVSNLSRLLALTAEALSCAWQGPGAQAAPP